MEDDAATFVQKFHECQTHGNLIHTPCTPLHSVSSLWPFYSWGLDIIGKINPPSSKQHEYIITAIEYFTKWVEAIPLRGTTGATIAAFIKEYIICRFGVPKHIITDNGTPFANKQGNGQAESTNKTLIRILSRMVHDNPRTWHEQLPMALWAYRAAPGVSPYSLVYGADAILPAEIQIPSARIAAASGVQWNETEASSSRIEKLYTLDSRRIKAEEHAQAYGRRISRAYDKVVKPRVFQIGDLVLKTAKHIQQDMSAPKFSTKWEGPYLITRAYNSGQDV
ncbi:protein NYNRIN-like [Papaver somniferum]|uniref:protein NYNRIN-like n=1 Tax=Papaver somniferum TaxID=3469 RepID=UPI000E705F23|nr:protein NYNRIN-like [Papaver somniferum]